MNEEHESRESFLLWWETCQGVTVGALQEKLIAHLGSHTLKEVRLLILAIFGESLHKKSELTWELCVVCSSLILGCGLESRNHIPVISTSGGQQKQFEGIELLVKISHLYLWCFGLLGVLQGFLKVLRFWGFRFWGLKKLKSRQVILTSEGKNMNKFFQDSMSLVAYIKHSCIHQAHISGHLIVVCLWTWSLFPSTNIQLKRSLQMEAFLGYSNYPKIIPEATQECYDVFMHYPAISLEITPPPHISWIILAILVFLGFGIFEIFGHKAFPHLPRPN